MLIVETRILLWVVRLVCVPSAHECLRAPSLRLRVSSLALRLPLSKRCMLQCVRVGHLQTQEIMRRAGVQGFGMPSCTTSDTTGENRYLCICMFHCHSDHSKAKRKTIWTTDTSASTPRTTSLQQVEPNLLPMIWAEVRCYLFIYGYCAMCGRY